VSLAAEPSAHLANSLQRLDSSCKSEFGVISDWE
jgi:hypothetical protein